MQPKSGQYYPGTSVSNSRASSLKNEGEIRIGVSGKRMIAPGEIQRVYEEIKQRITEILKQNQISDFVGLTSLATGADTIFAQVVLKEFHKPLHVILPFPVEEYKRDFSEQDLKVFLELLRQSREIEISNSSVPAKPSDRDACYFVCGRRIAEACHDMIFVWDKQKPGGVGGTGEIMGFFGEKSGQRQVNYIKVNPVNKDLLDAELVKGYEESNSAAIRARDKYRLVWKSAILIGWAAAGCFALITAFRIEGTAAFRFTLLEFIAFAMVSLLIYFARRLNYHTIYLEKRCEAETYRLLKIFYHIGVPVKISDRSNEEETMFSRLAARINNEVEQSISPSKWYSQYVIKELIRDQVEYHNNKTKSIGNKHAVYERISRFIGWTFLINLGVHLGHLYLAEDSAAQTLLYKLNVFLSIQLPATYVAIEGFIYFNEWAVLKKYSISSQQALSNAWTYLLQDIDNKTFETCHKSHATVLNFLSEIMITDNKNWKALLQSKDNYTMVI